MQIRLRPGLWIQRATIAMLAGLLLLVGCRDDRTAPQEIETVEHISQSPFGRLNPALHDSVKEIALDYVVQIGTDFNLIDKELERLREAVRTLIDLPSNESLDRVRQTWLSAHSSYELTTLHRYFISQILHEPVSSELSQLKYQIDHWPIVPGYIDYVAGYLDSGVVSDVNVTLDAASLRDQHGSFDVSEVILGFHVLEFLIWGSGIDSGSRPATDYRAIVKLSPAQIENGFSLEQLVNNRRRALLTLVTDTLLEDFRSLQSHWPTQLPEIRQSIEAMAGSEIIVILADSMTAMLTEELLLRSLYPMLNGDFVESIQSPYSRSTQIAVSTQLSGLERLLLERQAEDGTTLDLVFAAVSDEFSEFFYQNFDASKSCLVLLYSNVDSETVSASSQAEIQIVECINLLTNMVDHIERLKIELTN